MNYEGSMGELASDEAQPERVSSQPTLEFGEFERAWTEYQASG